jgi:hypothetical protein
VFVGQLLYIPSEIFSLGRTPIYIWVTEAAGHIYIPNWAPELYHKRIMGEYGVLWFLPSFLKILGESAHPKMKKYEITDFLGFSNVTKL